MGFRMDMSVQMDLNSFPIDFHGFAWMGIGFHMGFPWIFMGFRGDVGFHMGLRGFSMDFPGFAWMGIRFHMNFHGFSVYLIQSHYRFG